MTTPGNLVRRVGEHRAVVVAKRGAPGFVGLVYGPDRPWLLADQDHDHLEDAIAWCEEKLDAR